MPKGTPLDVDLFVEAKMAGQSVSECAILAGSTSSWPRQVGGNMSSREDVIEALRVAKEKRTERLESIWNDAITWMGEVIRSPRRKTLPTNIDRNIVANTVGRALGAFQPTVVEHRHFKVPMKSLLDAQVIDAVAGNAKALPVVPPLDSIPCDP